jgi:hypothetical protein
MRFLKDTGYFRDFIKHVMQKHRIGFQESINLIKSNPDICFLINKGGVKWTNGNFDRPSLCYTVMDKTTTFYDKKFYEYKPKC